MKKLGMQVEPIEDVQSIVIKTPKGTTRLIPQK